MEQYIKGFKGFTPVKMSGLSPLASFNIAEVWSELSWTISEGMNNAL